MPCKITTTWCQSMEKCSAKVEKDGDPFIDPPQSSLSPAQGSSIPYGAYGWGPMGIDTVDWQFKDGKWSYQSWNGSSYVSTGNVTATRVQQTKLVRTCQTYSVCYESVGQCPGGDPLGTPAPGTFDDYSNWSNTVDSMANTLGGSPSATMPTLPITLSSDQTTSISNSGTGSSTPRSTTSSGASANCLSFSNPVETVNYPTSAPQSTTSNGPTFESTN